VLTDPHRSDHVYRFEPQDIRFRFSILTSTILNHLYISSFIYFLLEKVRVIITMRYRLGIHLNWFYRFNYAARLNEHKGDHTSNRGGCNTGRRETEGEGSNTGAKGRKHR